MVGRRRSGSRSIRLRSRSASALFGHARDGGRRGVGGGARDREGAERDRAADARRAVIAARRPARGRAGARSVAAGDDVIELARFAEMRVERRRRVGDAARPAAEGELGGDDRRGRRRAAPDAPARRVAAPAGVVS